MQPTELNISWSQLRTHAECKQKSFLLRGGKRSKTQNLRNFYHGMVVDRAMCQWLADPERQPGAMEQLVDEAIVRVAAQAAQDGDGVVRWRSTTDREEMRLFCLELVRRLEPILDAEVTPYEFISAHRFKVPVSIPYLDGQLARVNLIGEMDLSVRQPNGDYKVWDLKGTADNSYHRKVLGQLIFYDIAIYALYGAPTVEVGLIQPMCDQRVLRFAVGEAERNTMWSWISSYASDVWRGEAACKATTAGCGWCEVKHACERFSSSDAFGLGAP